MVFLSFINFRKFSDTRFPPSQHHIHSKDDRPDIHFSSDDQIVFHFYIDGVLQQPLQNSRKNGHHH